MPALLTIDFEASCLPRHGLSFPIEVAIADMAGNCRSWLIQPEPVWDSWGWTADAEALHGLSRAFLMRHGLPARQVMDELNAAVAGARVFADHDLDQQWLGTLAETTGIPANFRIDHAARLLDERMVERDLIPYAREVANRRVPQRHRAAPDATWLATLLAELLAAKLGDERPLFDWAPLSSPAPPTAHRTAIC